ncbi:uncharacterized protein LOC142369375 [Odontesthes bonariensis]|uniref:uncharacterized protein LOC142369375 n=1 Tax=Odontesthes bonariensis TaxID=219752 RepID=UPI003F580F92
MSLQVCHCCGWSKVTTYHGLRVHQGRMGCTPKGMRFAEPEQQCMLGYAGLTNAQMDLKLDLKLDIRTSIKTETTGYNSDLSLQVCHCGWTKMSTYQGLRIHQGKMGCTPKGIRIPKNEQNYWKCHWEEEEEVDHSKRPRAKRMVVKKENFPEPPRQSSCRSSVAKAAKTEEEYKSLPRRSTRRSAKSNSGHQPEAFSARPQVNRTVYEHSTPANPADVVRAKKNNPKRQTLPQKAYIGAAEGYWSTDRLNDYAGAAARVKEEPKSPFAVPELSVQRATKTTSGQQLQGYSCDVQVKRFTEPPAAPAVRPKVMGFVKEHLPVTYREPAAQPKQKHRLEPTWSQGNGSVRNQLLAPLVLPPEKKDSPLCKATRERSGESQLLQEIQNFLQRKNKMRGDEIGGKRPAEPASENALIPPSVSSPKTAATMAENKSPSTPAQRSRKKPTNIEAGRQSSSPAEQVIKERLSTPPVVPPKKSSSPLFKAKLKEKAESEVGRDIKASFSQKENKMGEEKPKDIRPVEPARENASAEVSATTAVTEEKKSPFPSAQRSLRTAGHQLPDLCAAEQVNRSVRERPKAPPKVPPKKEDSSLFKARLKKSESGLEREVQSSLGEKTKMRREKLDVIRPAETACKIVRDASSAQIAPADAELSQKEDPTSLDEAAQPDFCTGLKVRELARMFSATTAQTDPAGPEEKLGGGHRLSQAKPLAQRFPAVTGQETDVQGVRGTDIQKATTAAEVSQKDAGEAAQADFPTSRTVKELARMFSVLEPAARPTEKQGAKSKLSQKSMDSTRAATKTKPAAAETAAEDHSTTLLSGFPRGLKVKDLARMFSATAARGAVGPTERQANGGKPARVVGPK